MAGKRSRVQPARMHQSDGLKNVCCQVLGVMTPRVIHRVKKAHRRPPTAGAVGARRRAAARSRPRPRRFAVEAATRSRGAPPSRGRPHCGHRSEGGARSSSEGRLRRGPRGRGRARETPQERLSRTPQGRGRRSGFGDETARRTSQEGRWQRECLADPFENPARARAIAAA